MKHFSLGAVLLLIALPCPTLPCSICGGDFRNRQSLRQEVAAARVVVIGTLTNARLNPDRPGEGQTELRIEQVVKGRDVVPVGATIIIPRYLPGDGKDPQKCVYFLDVSDGRLKPGVGRTIRTDQFAIYLNNVAAFTGPDVPKLLPFYLRHLDHADADVAADAFLEVARAADADLARAAKVLPAERLRRLLTNAQTPPERIGLCAFLLACAGSEKDADLMREMLKKVPEDRLSMRRGLLAGYIALKPDDGWEMALGILTDSKRGFVERHAVIGVLEFFHNWKPEENRERILRGMKSAVETGDLADLAAEDLRRWEWWDLTDTVLAQFNKKSHDAPMVRRAILRYALVCPQPAARKFADAIKRRDPRFYVDVQESLLPEKPPSK